MKRFLCVIILCFLSLLNIATLKAQLIGKPSYPVIFLHGFISSDLNWANTIDSLSQYWGVYTNNHVFHAVLNAYGSMTNITGADGILGTIDDDVLVTFNNENNQLPYGNLYAMNFNNFWNQNQSNPQILIHNNSTPGANESPSNQCAIYKQGYALKKMIEAVLSATGAEKVILIGHSMGGLEIREYLQRKEGGVHKWWVDPNANDGHKVAKVVTFGTPHLGSNFFNLGLANSESVRDLRYGYNTFFRWAPNPITDEGVYLFGGSEMLTSMRMQGFHNYDINCDGDDVDLNIDGINDGNTNGQFNSNMPLPTNVEYTWIVSDDGGIGDPDDGIVRVDRQWLYSIGDTVRSTFTHIQEPDDIYSIIRSLDEPDEYSFAYKILLDSNILGFVTFQPGMNAIDKDYYSFSNGAIGNYSFIINGNSPVTTGVDSIIVLDTTLSIRGHKIVLSFPDTLNVSLNVSNYYLIVRGTANSSSWQNPYTIKIQVDSPSVVVNPINRIPESFVLYQNYPNPFNPSTIIKYGLPKMTNIAIKIYNVLGQEVRTLMNMNQTAGYKSVVWDGRDNFGELVSSGIYLYRLQSSEFVKARKLLLIR